MSAASVPVARDGAGVPRHRGIRGSGIARTVALAGFVFLAVVPFVYVLLASLRHSRALYVYPPQWIPDPLYFGNYGHIFRDTLFARWTVNTVFVAGTVAFAKMLLDSMAGYALARLTFVGRGVIGAVMLACVMVPIGVLIIPLFFMVRSLHLLNTYWALLLPPLANPVGVFMMRAYIRAVPEEIEHAARLDGCSAFGIYWRMVLPLVRPGLFVVGLYTFVLQYTNFVWPLVVISDEHKFMLTNGLATLRSTFFLRDWGLISAASVLAMIPITAIFIALQRYFVGSSAAGALKG
jgi:multiple sugar transport system permease protein